MRCHDWVILLVLAATSTAAAEPPAPATNAAAPQLQIRPFPLADVQLLDGPFKEAMQRNATYLLALEPDRLLHNTRKIAGLEPKGAIYGGWEAQGIAGHTLGHYLTALSQQFAATHDPKFRERIDYIVAEMAECQVAYDDGYVGALPPKELATLRGLKEGKVELKGGFNFQNGAWVPWYTQHKVLAGLKDAWVLAGNAQAKEVALKLADWVDNVTANLTDEQLQAMLGVEHGGMLEVLVELYALTGNEHYLKVSRRFYHRAIFDPLLAGRDELARKHANTQIPKITGLARTYEVTGDADARTIAEFFWDLVVGQHTFVIGGNSDGEHFFPPETAAQHLTPASAETCNTYNMLKLTEHLFGWQPKVAYADYYERALYNQILPSQEPRQGMFAYYISLKPGHFKTYSTPLDSFWCCVGTGMENHTQYGRAIYCHDDTAVYVNLFIPSILTWKDKNLVLEQRTDYPRDEQTELIIQSAPSDPLTLRVRCPGWATGPLKVELNGQPLDAKSAPGGYAEINRAWRQGDRVRVSIPMSVRCESPPGAPAKTAFLYGPLVLAGDFGPAPETKSFPYAKIHHQNFRAPCADVPALVVPDGKPLESLLAPLPDEKLAFRIDGLVKPVDVTLRPFVDLPYHRYNIYWDILSPAEADERRSTPNSGVEK